MISDDLARGMEGFSYVLYESAVNPESDKFSPVLAVLGKVGESMVAHIANDAGSTSPTSGEVFDLPEEVKSVNFNRTNSGLAATVSMAVQETIALDSCKKAHEGKTQAAIEAFCNVEVNLSLNLDMDRRYSGTANPPSLELSRPARITLTGTLSNSYVSLEFKPLASGSHISFSEVVLLMADTEIAGWKDITDISVVTSDFALNLPVEITELNRGEDAVKVVATVAGGIGVADIGYVARTAEDEKAPVASDQAITVNALQGVELAVAALISSEHGDSFDMNANLSAENTGGARTYTILVKQECEDDCEQTTELEITGETATDFLTVAATGSFEAILAGIAEPLNVEFDGGRASDALLGIEKLSLASGDISYLLKGNFDHEGNIVSFDALNDAGLHIEFTTDETSGEPSGNIVDADGNVVAVITDGGEGKRRITYPDESWQEF